MTARARDKKKKKSIPSCTQSTGQGRVGASRELELNWASCQVTGSRQAAAGQQGRRMSIEVPRPGPSPSHPPAARVSETARDLLLQGHPVLRTDTSCTPRVSPRQRRACPDSAAAKKGCTDNIGRTVQVDFTTEPLQPPRGGMCVSKIGCRSRGMRDAPAQRRIEKELCASSGTPASGTVGEGTRSKKMHCIPGTVLRGGGGGGALRRGKFGIRGRGRLDIEAQLRRLAMRVCGVWGDG